MRLRTIIALFCLSTAFSHIHLFAENEPRIIHVFVALADNENQNIVPVPAALGNGDDPGRNLYWGALYGVEKYFKRDSDWSLISSQSNINSYIIKRILFVHNSKKVYIVADAYRGKQIRQCIEDFLFAAAGQREEKIQIDHNATRLSVDINKNGSLMCYAGHNGLMDFILKKFPAGTKRNRRDVIILACWSKQYFTKLIKRIGAYPLLWTTERLAPEAYTLEAAIEGWINNNSPEEIRNWAAEAYHRYQKCGIRAAKRLLVSGF